MIIYFVPLVPIIVAILLIMLGLADSIASVTNVLTNILWYIMIPVPIINVIIVFASSVTRNKSLVKKISICIIATIANIFSLYMTNTFFVGLNSIYGSGGLGEAIEFWAVLLFGGALWLGIIALGAYASFSWFSDDDETPYVSSVLSIIGMVVIGGIFGFLG